MQPPQAVELCTHLPTSVLGGVNEIPQYISALAAESVATEPTNIEPRAITDSLEIFPSSPKRNEEMIDFILGRFII
jgi:hypothetical protein